jgi:O-antigen/teichoic acid export membrane protein
MDDVKARGILRNSLTEGTLWYSLGSVMFALNSMLMLMAVSRVAGVQAAGEFGIAYAISYLLYIIGLFGVNHYQITDYKNEYSFGGYFYAKLITSAIMMLIFAIIFAISSYPFEKSMHFFLLTTYMMVNSFAEVYQSLFFKENRLTLYGSSLFFRTLLSFIAFVACLYVTNSVISALIACNVVNVVATFFLSVLPSREFIQGIDYRRNCDDYRPLLMKCLPICISLFLTVFLINSTKYVIDYQGDDIMQGYFNILFMPTFVITLFSDLIFKLQLNAYSSYIQEQKLNLLYKLFFKHITLVAGLTIVGASLGGLFGPDVLGFIFNVDLTPYGQVITLIIVGGGFLATSWLFYYILIILRAQMKFLYSYLICSILSIPLGVALIGHMGIVGASISFTLSYLLLVGIFFFIVWYYLRCAKDG